MPNTIVLQEALLKRTEKFLEKSLVFAPLCNREFEGEISDQWDTVRVAQLPELSGTLTDTTGSGALSVAGNDITAQNFAYITDAMTVNQVWQAKYVLKELEELRAKQNVRLDLAHGIAYANRKVWDLHIYSRILANAGTLINANQAAATTETSATIYQTFLEMKEALMLDDVDASDLVFCVTPEINTILKLSDIYDGSDGGLGARLNGQFGNIDGTPIIVHTQKPNSGENNITLMKRWAANFVNQFTKMKVTESTDGFNYKMPVESVFECDVLHDVNKKAIVTKFVTNGA